VTRRRAACGNGKGASRRMALPSKWAFSVALIG